MRRFLLAPFPVLAAIMGLAYVFGSPIRTQTPTFVAARSIIPLEDWGLVFLLGATVLFAGMAVGNHVLLSWSLIAGGALYTWWAVLFVSAALTDPKASLTGWAIHGTIAYWHYVTAWWIRKNP